MPKNAITHRGAPISFRPHSATVPINAWKPPIACEAFVLGSQHSGKKNGTGSMAPTWDRGMKDASCDPQASTVDASSTFHARSGRASYVVIDDHLGRLLATDHPRPGRGGGVAHERRAPGPVVGRLKDGLVLPPHLVDLFRRGQGQKMVPL